MPRAHSYWKNPKARHGHLNCNPWCTPEAGTRVPDTQAGRDKHDAHHERYGVNPDTFTNARPLSATPVPNNGFTIEPGEPA